MDKLFITGGTGFLGKYVTDIMSKDYRVWSMGRRTLDLMDRESISSIFEEYLPDYVIHLAGYNGGIKFNLDFPADIFYKNTIMGLNLLDVCANNGVKKIVSMTTSCAYPKTNIAYINEPFYNYITAEDRQEYYEQTFFDGDIDDTVACHGFAKRNLALASNFYKKQYGLNAVTLCSTTLYGPGDSFDVNKTKVMGGLIAKFVQAKQRKEPVVTCWGTGNPLREFLYVADAAKLMSLSLLTYNDNKYPLNIGSGQEVSIKQLAEMVAKVVKYNGRIEWDTSKPDGQYRKKLNLNKQKQVLGDISFTPLEEGIQNTVDWYWRNNETCSIS